MLATVLLEIYCRYTYDRTPLPFASFLRIPSEADHHIFTKENPLKPYITPLNLRKQLLALVAAAYQQCNPSLDNEPIKDNSDLQSPSPFIHQRDDILETCDVL